MATLQTHDSAWHIPLADTNHSFRLLSAAQKTLCLSKKIADAMAGTGLSRQDFAKRMHVQPSIITRWLSGHHNFTVATLFEIEDALQIQLLDLGTPTPIKTVELKMTYSSGGNMKQQDDLASYFAASLVQFNGSQAPVETKKSNSASQHFSTHFSSSKK